MGSWNLSQLSRKLNTILGLDPESSNCRVGRAGRAGVMSSAVFLLIVAAMMTWLSSPLQLPSLALATLGVLLFIFSLKTTLTRSRANLMGLLGHICALFSFYIFYTRMVNVTYATDSIVGTYMGVIKVLQIQNPYSYTIKPLLDQLGFPPSFYSPHVDGTFEFHLNYPAMNFLSLIPAYIAGLHDLRDGVFIFHLVTVLLVFGLVPSRWKALSLAPFAFGFPLAIGYSWTDNVWAFFVLLTAVLWRRNKGPSLLSFGLAAATKQIALVAAPFLLIRLWNDTDGSKTKSLIKGSMFILAGFLAPNLPFIIASPASWWAATVGPYLPSKTPLIPSGIGLSELLPDIGLALSPTFYNVLTVAVCAVCLSAFTVRYKRLNPFLWTMPAIILFFYARSFPNYIVYWMIPYIFETFAYGKPSLNLLRFRAFSTFSLRTSGRYLLGSLKRRVGPSLLTVLALTAVLAGTSGAYVAQASRPMLDVKVTGTGDPESLGVATNVAVSITNYGSQAVSPSFFVKWFFLWNLWRTNRTAELQPSSEASYTLIATDALAAVPRGSPLRVAVYDSVSGQFLGLSKSYTSDVPRPPVANPRFTWWTLDTGTGRQVPFPWKLSLVDSSRAEAAINKPNGNTSGVEFRLNSTIDQGPPQELTLSQRVLFNETNLNVLTYRPLPTGSPEGTVLGAKATDGIHFLFYIFSPSINQRTVTVFESNTTVTLPVGYSGWQSVDIDIQAAWLSQGWDKPVSLEVSFFLRSSSAGLSLANLQEVTSESSGAG